MPNRRTDEDRDKEDRKMEMVQEIGIKQWSEQDRMKGQSEEVREGAE